MKLLQNPPKDVNSSNQPHKQNDISGNLIKKIKETEISKKQKENLRKQETQKPMKNKGLIK